MRENRVIEQNRCYHLISWLAHRAFFLDDEEKDRAVAPHRPTYHRRRRRKRKVLAGSAGCCVFCGKMI